MTRKMNETVAHSRKRKEKNREGWGSSWAVKEVGVDV